MFIDITAIITSSGAPVKFNWGVIGRDLPSKAEVADHHDSVTGVVYSILSVHNLSPSDTGNYTITATNEYGTSVAFAPVQVLTGIAMS